jgi:outer membrane protein TolC
MMVTTFLRTVFIYLAGLAFLFLTGFSASGADFSSKLTLDDTIDLAIKANLGLKRSQEEVKAATSKKRSARTEFFPTLRATYSYINRDKELTQEITPGFDVVTRPRNEYAFVTEFNQPIFTGFALINQYRIASLGLDVAELAQKLTRQDITLDAKNAYYLVLRTQKLMDVAKQTVAQIKAQKEVAKNFYEVGMSPLNDLLQSQVQLANAKQRLITAQNNLAVANSQFNIVLRRPVNSPVAIEDIVDYVSFKYDIDYCLGEAKKNRLEIYVANLDIEIAEKQVKLVQKDYLPTVVFRGGITQVGDDWQAFGGDGVNDAYSWNLQATATWEFWQWGKTTYDVKAQLSRLTQSKYRKAELLDNISLEVKQSFLRTIESQQNILTIETAIEQAKENLRINEERYREQVSTQTEVLIAQTLLTETMTNYYSALYDYKIAKAVLYRAIGLETIR